MKSKILSIVPAQPGWFAQFENSDGKWSERVICHALIEVEEGGGTTQYVTSIISDADGFGSIRCDENPDYGGDVYKPESS